MTLDGSKDTTIRITAPYKITWKWNIHWNPVLKALNVENRLSLSQSFLIVHAFKAVWRIVVVIQANVENMLRIPAGTKYVFRSYKRAFMYCGQS